MSGGHESNSGVVHGIAKSIYRLKYIIVVFWVVLTAFMAPYAYQLVLRSAPMVKHPPEGTASAAAMGEFDAHFANFSTLRREMVSFRCKSVCATAATVLVKGWVEALTDMLKHFEVEHPGSIIQIHSYFSFATHHQLGKNIMISEDQQSILLQWVWNVPLNMKQPTAEFCNKIAWAIDALNEYQGDDGIEVKATGLVFLDQAMKDTLIEEIPVHEISTIWLPFIILALALRSARMLILALIPMPIEILTAFGIMYFVSLTTPVVMFALMMMLMLCTSLSFDYALFSLTRYAEERAAGETVEDAIVTVIAQSGRVIVVSGVVLMIAWGAMLGLPSPFNGFCIAACSMIITCVFVQLTFVPSLLACLPFLGPAAAQRDVDIRELEVPDKVPREKSDGSSRGASKHIKQQEHDDDPFAKALPHMGGPWFALGGFLTRFPMNILLSVFVYAAMMPLTLRMTKNFDFWQFKFKMGHSYELTMPRTADEWQTLLQIQHDFPSKAGILMPMLIMMTGDTEDGGQLNVANQEAFDINCHMLNAILESTEGKSYGLTPESFLSATTDGVDHGTGRVKCLKFWQVNMMRSSFWSKNVLFSHTSAHLQELWDQVMSSDKHAMLTFLFPTMDPFSPQAFNLVTDIREVVNREAALMSAQQPGLKFKTFSPGSVLMDLIDVTSGQLPICFAICAVVCLTLIALWFWAFFIPFKLLLTVIVPLSWTYGAGLYVYEDGCLAWTGFAGLTPIGDAGVDWTVPMFTLTFMMGLALDYEIFLFERVREFREEGFGDCESIQLGLAATGTTISAAGMIMALTFFAQLLGSIPVTNQMGFILVFSIVVDTFVVRSILVPAMLSLVPCSNYWPCKMPEPRYTWLDGKRGGKSSSNSRSSKDDRSSSSGDDDDDGYDNESIE